MGDVVYYRRSAPVQFYTPAHDFTRLLMGLMLIIADQMKLFGRDRQGVI